jgi:hypothetical protein
MASLMLRRGLVQLAVLSCLLLLDQTARAQDAGAETPTLSGAKRVAVLSFDALGLDQERVTRLEALFRMELERLAGRPSPSPREIQTVLKSSSSLRNCAGTPKCLAKIGQKLKADFVVSGNVAGLADSYVVNIKVVDSATATELRKIASDPLRGNPDELIEAVRVSAYKLLAPERLRGSVTVLADINGAQVSLDGKVVGITPLKGSLKNISLGAHKLSVKAAGYSDFEEEVLVRFQKTTRVVVRLATKEGDEGMVAATGPARTVEKSKPFYKSPWFYAGVGAAVIAGGIIGWQLGKNTVVDCTEGNVCD